MTITAQQLVDAVRLLRFGGSRFMDENEADRLSAIAKSRTDRYESLKRTSSFEECDMISSAEMLADVMGISSAGIEEEVKERFRRQMEAWKAEVRAERAAHQST